MTSVKILSLAVALLQPGRMYFQQDHPVPVTVDRAAVAQLVPAKKGAPLKLVMLSGAGRVEASVELGENQPQADLAMAFTGQASPGPHTGLWDGNTHYIQLVAGDIPIGSPLVVIPLADPVRRGRGKPDALRIVIERQVVMRTDFGKIQLSLDHEVAPNTAMHFEHLVAGGFYTNVIFHRVVPGFVIQSGDPTGRGSGGPGYLIDLEVSGKPHVRGTLSMARRGQPDTAGSQFFICLTREGCKSLDGKYAAFGVVVEGMAVVDKIAAAPIADRRNGRPRDPTGIKSAWLVPAPPRPIRPDGSAGEGPKPEK